MRIQLLKRAAEENWTSQMAREEVKAHTKMAQENAEMFASRVLTRDLTALERIEKDLISLFQQGDVKLDEATLAAILIRVRGIDVAIHSYYPAIEKAKSFPADWKAEQIANHHKRIDEKGRNLKEDMN